jgi:hypothetical protein
MAQGHPLRIDVHQAQVGGPSFGLLSCEQPQLFGAQDVGLQVTPTGLLLIPGHDVKA